MPPAPRIAVAVAGLLIAIVAGGCGSSPVERTGARPETLVAADAGPATTTPAVATGSTGPTTVPVPPPPLVLLDTDLGSDIDDALALAMLHGYEDRGLVELASVTISRDSETAARYADTLNTLLGHPGLPVGIDRSATYFWADADSYVSLVGEMRVPGAAAEPAPDAVPVLRRALARAVEQDRRTLVVQVGFSGNLAALLESGPDGISPRTGEELVAASGALLSIMAGSFDADGRPIHVEFNVKHDIEAARRLVAGWPGEVVISPFELGDDLHVPYAAIRDGLPGGSPGQTHPIRRAYEFQDLEWHRDAPPFYDMKSWDLTSVLQAVEPEAGWFPISSPGTVTVDGDGRTTFVAGPGRHRILLAHQLTDGQREAAIGRMVELITVPA